MDSNQPSTWRSFYPALTLASLLGLLVYLTLLALPTAAAGLPNLASPSRMSQAAVSPLQVTITGPTAGAINTASTFTATVTPTTTTLPVTYTWQATEQSQVVTTTSTLSHSIIFTWITTGAKAITVTATNEAGTVTTTHAITIDLNKVYLPIISKLSLDLVDDFDDGQDPNVLGGFSGTAWPSPCPPTVGADYDPLNGYNNSPNGYRLSYNVTPICYGVWQTDLRDYNYSGFSTLTFWIRGALGGEEPHIYLQDSDNCQFLSCRYFVNVKSFLPGGQVTTQWQQARIPLSVFAIPGVNLTRLRFFQIAFEHNNLAGTIYIDEIRFE
ncbi:MAG: hypothetical protein HYR94_18805 [Chloroflexi bacterium]|nr:hypothetical protein [Chloroflexota bacterium]